MNKNSQKITFELKHGYYAIIETGEDKYLHRLDVEGETFEKSLTRAYEIVEGLNLGDEAKIVHVGNYDIERKMEAGN